jgi:hypothetical protein
MLTRIALRAFALAVPVHFAWEMAQMGLFTGVSTEFWASIPTCALASVGDGVLTLAILTVGTVLFGTAAWPGRRDWRAWLALGGLSFGVAVVMEWVNVYGLGRWAYDSDMVMIPGLRVGLTPVVQMLLLTPPILRWAAHAPASRAPGTGHGAPHQLGGDV